MKRGGDEAIASLTSIGMIAAPARPASMKTRTLGHSSLVSSRLAYGCARIAGTWKPAEVTPDKVAAGVRAVAAAFEAGYTLFDNADIYCRGKCEEILGRALKEIAGMRGGVLVATKCGIQFADDPSPGVPYRYNLSADHILRSCEQSLRRLGIETIDLYHLHRADLLLDPAEVAGAFEQLHREGKVRHFGVSNFTPSLLALLRKACPMPLLVNQVEISLTKLDCLTDGTLDQCQSESITPLAWSPLGGGTLGDGAKLGWRDPKRKRMARLNATLAEIATRLGTTWNVVALAWLLKHPAGIVPIVGSTNPERIRGAVKALELDLSREDLYQLLEAARGERLP